MTKISAIHRQVAFANLTGESVGPMRFWLSWEEHEPFLLRLCLGWVGGNEAEARELLSSAMLKAWEGAQKASEEIGNYRAWLARIVRNHCIDQQRRQNRDPQVKTDPELLAPIAEGARVTHQASPESALLKEESYARLLARMDRLPMRLKEVMMLRAYQNMSYKEIGQRLQISTENARKRVQMARSLLKGEISTDQLPQPSVLLEERAATEAILDTDRLPSTSGARYATPVEYAWQGLTLELPVLLDLRPMRLAQKTETLRKYIERHPGGWKKELELARLLWAMGEAREALARMAATFERQPQEAELALSYLRALQAVGDRAAIVSAVRLALADGQLTALRDLLVGYEAWALGEWADAEWHWRMCERLGGGMPLARMWLEQGRDAEVAALLAPQLQAHPMGREAFFWMAVATSGTRQGAEIAELAVRRFPHDPYAVAGALAAQWRAGDMPDAARKVALAEASRLAPESYLMMALKAACLHGHGDHDKAGECVDAFLKAHPQHLQAHHFAHKLALLSGQPTQAAHFERRLTTLHEAGAMPSMALDLPLRFLDGGQMGSL